jgi:hypothetical protein
LNERKAITKTKLHKDRENGGETLKPVESQLNSEAEK